MTNQIRALAAPKGFLLQLFVGLFLVAALTGNALAEKINLNTADAETLAYIPGIGPSKAQEIITMREANGGFKTMEELLSVRGIGDRTLEVIRQHGALDGGVSSLTEEMRSNPPKQTATGSASSNSG